MRTRSSVGDSSSSEVSTSVCVSDFLAHAFDLNLRAESYNADRRAVSVCGIQSFALHLQGY